MTELHDDEGLLVATDTFSVDCPNCGPGTVRYLNGQKVPHGCDYEPPSVVIECGGPPPQDLDGGRRGD